MHRKPTALRPRSSNTSQFTESHMQQILLMLQILVAVGLIGVVLIQHGRGADAGAAFGSGSAGSVFGARGPATLLTRVTAVLALVFFVNSMALAYMAKQHSQDTRSVVEQLAQPAQDGAANGDAPESTSDVPAAPGADAQTNADGTTDVPAPPGDGATGSAPEAPRN